ncbi:hypothetical protein D3C86_391960 [compost metagenome]
MRRAPLSKHSKLLAFLAAGLIALSFLFPLWSMTMVAPMYPDGLHLHVFANRFGGSNNPNVNDLAEINTLNHYIGMAELHAENFPELTVLPIAFGLAFILALLAAFRSSKLLLGLTLTVLGLVGTGGLATAYMRLYQYGHNLDPLAPVKVEPFTPVMLGTNALANFVTTGYFNVGGYLMMAACVLIAASVFLPAKRS